MIGFCVVARDRAFVPQALGYEASLRLLSDDSLGLAHGRIVMLQLGC